jgi:hypothetical protein
VHGWHLRQGGTSASDGRDERGRRRLTDKRRTSPRPSRVGGGHPRHVSAAHASLAAGAAVTRASAADVSPFRSGPLASIGARRLGRFGRERRPCAARPRLRHRRRAALGAQASSSPSPSTSRVGGAAATVGTSRLAQQEEGNRRSRSRTCVPPTAYAGANAAPFRAGRPCEPPSRRFALPPSSGWPKRLKKNNPCTH